MCVDMGDTTLVRAGRPLDIMMRGNGRVEQYEGNIVGFSNRLNTILVPQSFMDWANKNFAPEKEAEPSRLIVEVKNPTDTAITDYFQQKNYETEGNNLDAGKTTYFLRLITAIVVGVGLFISILAAPPHPDSACCGGSPRRWCGQARQPG